MVRRSRGPVVPCSGGLAVRRPARPVVPGRISVMSVNLGAIWGLLGVILGPSGAYRGQLEDPLEGPLGSKIKLDV